MQEEFAAELVLNELLVKSHQIVVASKGVQEGSHVLIDELKIRDDIERDLGVLILAIFLLSNQDLSYKVLLNEPLEEILLFDVLFGWKE